MGNDGETKALLVGPHSVLGRRCLDHTPLDEMGGDGDGEEIKMFIEIATALEGSRLVWSSRCGVALPPLSRRVPGAGSVSGVVRFDLDKAFSRLCRKSRIRQSARMFEVEGHDVSSDGGTIVI